MTDTDDAAWRQQHLLDPPINAMFTQDQIQFIERLIDKRVVALLSRPAAHQQPKAPKDYHTAPEIRRLITENLSTLREQLLIKPRLPYFSIDSLRLELAKITALREGDLAVQDKGQWRWERQVFNALEDWPECPFAMVKKGWYQFKEVQQ